MTADETAVQYTFQYQHPPSIGSTTPSTVIVTGTFDNWSKSLHPLKQSATDPRRFSASVKLHRPSTGCILFKFIVNGQWVLQDPAEKIDGKSAGYPVQTSPEGYVNHVLVWADICAAVASAAATTQSVAPVTAAASVKEAGVKEVKETAKAPGPAANETASKPVPASAAPVKTEASTKPAPASAAPVKTEASIKPASASAAVAPTKPVQVAGNEKAVKPETATVKIADKTTSEEKSKGKSEKKKKRCTII